MEDETKKSEVLKEVQEMIEQATRLLTSVLKGTVDVAAEYEMLIHSEPRLQYLLSV